MINWPLGELLRIYSVDMDGDIWSIRSVSILPCKLLSLCCMYDVFAWLSHHCERVALDNIYSHLHGSAYRGLFLLFP